MNNSNQELHSNEVVTEEQLVYLADLLGDAADASQEKPYSSNTFADIVSGALAEHFGREAGLSEGTGAKFGVLLADELVEDDVVVNKGIEKAG